MYELRVMAENLQGRSDPLTSDKPVVAKSQYTVPGAPGKPELIDSDKNHITIKWKQPISNGGSPIIGYDIERRDVNTGRWIKINGQPVPTAEYQDDRVTSNHQYQYRISAVNAAGNGKTSEPSAIFNARPLREKPRFYFDGLVESALSSCRRDSGKYTVTAANEFGKDTADIEVIVVDKPSPPEGPLSYTETAPDHISLHWYSPKDDGGSEITGYIIEFTEFGVDDWRPVPGACPNTNFTVKNLVEGKKYVFRIRAENIYGASEALEGKPVLAKSPFDPPGAPSQPTIAAYTPNSANLEWHPPDDCGGKPITGYIVERRERGVSNLRDGARYEFRVLAVNEAGPGHPSKPSDPMTAEHQRYRPDPPEPPKPDRITRNGVTLSWRPPRTDGKSRIKGTKP
ncbi:GD15479 [Drosophila simulans]|uniref:GD15479 n=1 Tax=Drosophila simulans TaxID=7240 RepID=B4NTM0_DROSI|nr:GD15479 [Drosophila simulans]